MTRKKNFEKIAIGQNRKVQSRGCLNNCNKYLNYRFFKFMSIVRVYVWVFDCSRKNFKG